jgi:hypothetical protein
MSTRKIGEPAHAPESRVGRFFNGASLAATAVMRSVTLLSSPMAFPTLAQTLQALESVKSEQSQSSYDCLSAILRASYDGKQLSKYDKLSDQYCDAMDGNDLQQDVVLAIQYLRSRDVTELVQALIGYFKDDDQFYELGHAMISLAFPRKRSTISPETLTDLQRDVLTSLNEKEAIWKCDGDLPALLKSRGLPTTKSKSRQLVTNSIKQG